MAAMSSAVKLLVIVVGMAALVDWRRGDAYSTGPPSTSCRSMTPSHYRAQPRTDPPPYVITFDSTQSTERRVEVTISSPSGSMFKGFLLQAKIANGRSAGQTVGTFYYPPRYSAMKLACNRKAVSHSVGRVQNSITATWRPPSRPTTDQIIFTATVVESLRNFWVNVTSEELNLSA